MTNIAIVTGGAGFIGSHMVDLLLKKKFKVRVIDDFSGGHKKNLIHHKKNKNLLIKKIDINYIKKNDKIFKNVKYVFHFAGIGDIIPSIEKPINYMQTNIQGTINILEASRHNKIKKLIYAASSSCYGNLTQTKPTSEKSNTDPQYPYAFSKYIGELTVLHWSKVYKIEVNIMRIFNAYGPRVRTTGAYGAVFGVFFKQKLSNAPLTVVGDGNQKRDFVYVTDVAKAFYLAAISKHKNKIYNIGTGSPKKINYLVKLLNAKKLHIPDRPGEPRSTWASVKKIKKELKWKPKINFKTGVKIMISNIYNWKDAPLWTPQKIKSATQLWYKYLSNQKKK